MKLIKLSDFIIENKNDLQKIVDYNSLLKTKLEDIKWEEMFLNVKLVNREYYFPTYEYSIVIDNRIDIDKYRSKSTYINQSHINFKIIEDVVNLYPNILELKDKKDYPIGHYFFDKDSKDKLKMNEIANGFNFLILRSEIFNISSEII